MNAIVINVCMNGSSVRFHSTNQRRQHVSMARGSEVNSRLGSRHSDTRNSSIAFNLPQLDVTLNLKQVK